MAAKYITQYALNGLTHEQFTMLVTDASQTLQWQLRSASENIVLSIPRSARSNGEKVIITFEGDNAAIESKNAQWQLTGAKKNRQNLEVLTNALDETRNINTPEQLTEKYNDLLARREAYEKDLEERRQSNNLTAAERISLGEGGRYITYTLIAMNTIVFIAMVIGSGSFLEFDTETLFNWGGNVRSLTASGEWYRLITNIFVHGGLVHLLFNMYALLYVGIYLEPLINRWRYLAAYMSCGICASLTSIGMHENIISIGASGAIFGLYGVFLALLTTNAIDKNMRKPLLQSITVFVGYNLIYGLKGNVDNAAHVGGLVSGAFFGYIFYFLFLKRKDNLAASILLTVALTVVTVVTVLPSIKDDTQKAAAAIDRFIPLQDSALAPRRLISDTSFSADVAKQLKNISLPIWQDWQMSLDSFDTAKVSQPLHEQIALFKTYVSLRLQETKLFINRESQQTHQYDSSIISVDKEIEDVLAKINKK